MVDLKNISSIYFLGIGGIGMSALARYFNHLGARVSGYDKTKTTLTRELIEEGMAVHFNDDVSMADIDAGLVVYTPAIPADHEELNFFMKKGTPMLKRSDVLGMITRDSFNICVAGTHGKTTTSTMIAHLLRDTGFGCNAFLGGISTNYDTNFWSSDKNVSVAEADEYDRSFLKLNPDIAVITSMDADHLDIYGTEEKMQDAFIEFSKKIKTGGHLIYKKGIKREPEFLTSNSICYSLDNEQSDVYAKNIKVENGAYVFDVVYKGKLISDIRFEMGGRHNIENAVACVAISEILQIDEKKMKSALSSFQGVKRRFQYIIKEPDMVMIDDYAHHPEELRALISGAKELFGSMKCTVVFQPHLFSRTRDLAPGFSEVLAMADEVILLPIYPAREKPIEGVTSEMILDGIKNSDKKIVEMKDITAVLKEQKPELLIMAGAGDIDTLVEPVKETLKG